MTERVRWGTTWGGIVGVAAAALAAACSSSTSAPLGTPCPAYSGGTATPATLAGAYTLSSFCQDTLPAFGPAQGVTGTLTMTLGASGVDSFQAAINLPGNPVSLAGPYTVSHDTIAVTLPGPLGTFVGTYRFAANTLWVSGNLPGSPPPPIAIVFHK